MKNVEIAEKISNAIHSAYCRSGDFPSTGEMRDAATLVLDEALIDVRIEREKLEARIKELEAGMQSFCDRVKSGEVRSVTTYKRFLALLAKP